MRFFAAIVAFAMSLVCEAASADTLVDTQGWQCNQADFAKFNQRVASHASRNLLARKGVKMIASEGAGSLDSLTDGDAGTLGDRGRCFISGRPTEITFYLGQPKVVKEIGVFSFNVDTRSNQDFEVRLADGSARPGVMPAFPARAQFTSGDRVLGHNHGGWHTRFIDPRGGPLTPGKVDWVQFRIWPTHMANAGEPAKTADSRRGAAVVVELEALGDEHDVVLPSPRELAYRKTLREAPRQPEFVKKGTWQETLIASREALLEWECLQDRLALHSFGMDFEPWYVLGPLPGKDPLVRQILEAREIDFAASRQTADGKSLTWQRRDDLIDGRIHDMAGSAALDKNSVLFLCRKAQFQRPTKRDEIDLDLTADRGSAHWLPTRAGFPVRTPVGFSGGGNPLMVEAGDYQLLVELRPDAQGHCRFYTIPQPNRSGPGAGNSGSRVARRAHIVQRVREEFGDRLAQTQFGWEIADRMWIQPGHHQVDDWLPGHVEPYLVRKYRQAMQTRLARIAEQLAETAGVKAEALSARKTRLTAWLAEQRQLVARERPFEGLRRAYYALAAVEELGNVASRLRSMRLAVEDQQKTFGPSYAKAGQFLTRIAGLESRLEQQWNQALAAGPSSADQVIALSSELDQQQTEMLLDTPLLAFDKLLLVKGHSSFAANWTGANHLGNEMVVLSPVRPDGKLTTLHRGSISDMDLHWNADRILFSDGRVLWEIKPDGTGLRRVSAEDPPVSHYDACYLPDGKIACISNACEQAVPCTGGGDVGNLHILNADGSGERRVSFDQDHNWNPVVMNDGRVLYTRWEYTDLPHYFSRMLFRMNPDGTGQMEYYGSNSYWPNALYWPRPIPGHPTMVSCVVSGHHGVSRVGELVMLDPARGRREADGAIQRIPGHGKRVEPIIRDNLVGESWPKFAAPYPLAEPGTNRGAGKYFLACVQTDPFATWDVCLVDVFDNITPILRGGYMMPIPLRARPMPPVVPSQTNPRQTDGVVYLSNVYQGDGLRGFPVGSIKALRVGTHHYRYAGNGDTRASSYEGGWDVKRLLGTVPVYEDGSALFRVPANTPIFVQPLDAEGKAQQQMRSWYTAMPGETASCVGCHERQNSTPPAHAGLAARRRPDSITPWFGPTRGFSFDREVQPVLDRRCVGCHNGQPCRVGDKALASIDLRAKRLRPDWSGDYSPAYMELQRYVRRAGYESDNHMHVPAEFEADTSVLVQILKKGHYNVTLDRTDWERLYTWIDFNIPYPVNWRESHRPPRDDQVERRAKYKKLFAGIDDHDEDPLPFPAVAAFEPPKPLTPTSKPLVVEGWPFSADQARAMQDAAGPRSLDLDLGEGVRMKLALVPAGHFPLGDPAGFPDEQTQAAVTISRPFYLGVFEVTNAQYARFDPRHDSAYIEGRWKDRTTRGTPINSPEQPVVRVSWKQAMAFCQWLSNKTGMRCTLPTEAEWEWACRAGSATPFNFGEYRPGANNLANIADRSVEAWNYGRTEPGYSDGVQYTAPGGRFPLNAWGLADMHGNVAEWCLTAYRPYPYRADDGRDDPRASGAKVVRGGSWNDTFRQATSASRWRYEPYKPVYNVGFRVRCEVRPPAGVAGLGR